MILPLLIAANPSPETVLVELIEAEPVRKQMIEHLDRSVSASAARLAKRGSGTAEEIDAALREQIAANLIDKMANRVPLDATSIERTVIDYELFKAEKFVSSGVFPKRYFGYFDEKHDTAEHERIMREAIRGGLLGRISSVEMSVHWDHNWVVGTAFDDLQHLILYDFAIHWFDAATTFFAT